MTDEKLPNGFKPKDPKSDGISPIKDPETLDLVADSARFGSADVDAIPAKSAPSMTVSAKDAERENNLREYLARQEAMEQAGWDAAW